MKKIFMVLCMIGCLGISISLCDEASSKNSTLITVDFKDAELSNVLRLLSDQYQVNIVAGETVKGTVTVRLNDVPFEAALGAILGVNGYGFLRQGNIYRVALLSEIAEGEKAKESLASYGELITDVIELRYLDAQDAKKVLDSMLSSRGKLMVLERRTMPGWQISGISSGVSSSGGSSNSSGSGGSSYSNLLSGSSSSSSSASGLFGARKTVDTPSERSKTLLVIDTPSRVQGIRDILKKMDRMPKQVMIDAMVVEISLSNEENLGIKWESLAGWKIKVAPSQTLTDQFTKLKSFTDDLKSTLDQSNDDTRTRTINNLSGNASSDTTTKTGTSTLSTTQTNDVSHSKTNTFSNLRTAVLSADELDIVLSALSTRGDVDVISNPNVLTLDNHEATILVGENFPIFSTSVSDQGTVTESFDYYQPVGISLRVIPQVAVHRQVNMLIHPSVSEIGSFVTGTTGLKYPRINIREADTQVLVEEKQTVVIGGLVTSHDEETINRVPLLGDIPLIGLAFRHKSVVKRKVNLMVFVTPNIIAPSEISESENKIFKKYLELKKVKANRPKKPGKFFSPPL
ncbi:MAG: hypothetical protein HYS07_07840 [Chlamydiae bacterium]|nr:hypothetical protein [Chlamydiota bacterium]MBI3277148.1 hypothetical protein [Chlamydiota bacterium]